MDDSQLPATILVIFGITGDLAHRYLLPALAAVTEAGKLPKDFKIVGVSRRDITLDQVFHGPQQCLIPHSEALQVDLESVQSYRGLKDKIEEVSRDFSSTPEI